MLFFLRAAALLDGLLLSYPLLAILEVSLTGPGLSAPLSLPRLGIVLLSGALGAFIGWLLDRMKNPPVRANHTFAGGGASRWIYCRLLVSDGKKYFSSGAGCPLPGVLCSRHVFCYPPFDELIGTSFLSLTMVAYLFGGGYRLVLQRVFRHGLRSGFADR